MILVPWLVLAIVVSLLLGVWIGRVTQWDEEGVEHDAVPQQRERRPLVVVRRAPFDWKQDAAL